MRISGRASVRLTVLAAGAVLGCLLAVAVVADGPTAADRQAPRPAAEERTGGEPVPPAARVAADGTAERAVRPRRRAGLRAGRPRQVVIPVLGVRAPVVPIETRGRVLLPPSDPTTVGWWSAGARPGAATGAAVVTGHTVSTGGGAFDDLDRLRPGHTVRVRTTHGVLPYVVDSVTAYPKQSLARHARSLFDQTARGRLVLVTCEDWNGEVYLSNQVVVASLA